MRIRLEQDLAVRHSRQVDIGHVLAPAGDKPDVLDTANRLAYPKAVHGSLKREHLATHYYMAAAEQ